MAILVAFNPVKTGIEKYRNLVIRSVSAEGGSSHDGRRCSSLRRLVDRCRGGPRPNSWDKLAPLAEWVENGKAPDFVVATHSTDGVVDNEQPICAYPKKAIYKGPSGGQSDPGNWVVSRFTCQ